MQRGLARALFIGVVAFGGLGLAGEAVPAAPALAPLRVGFAPFENQETVLRKAKPVVDALARVLGREVKPFVAGDYPGVVEAMRAGKLDVAFFSPAALVMAERVAGARVILKSRYKGRVFYHSAIVVRTNSPFKKLADLKGKRFAFVDPGSTTGGIFPRVMLMDAGLNPDRDFSRVIQAGGHDAALLAVLHGRVDACGTFANDNRGEDVPWKKMLSPAQASQLRALQYSDPIPNGAVAVRKDLDEATIAKVKEAFLSLSASPTGRAELAKMYLIEAFVPALSSDYAPVRRAMTRVGYRHFGG